MTRRELLARMDSRELSEWMAYSQVEPFGEERADLRAALVAMTMANLWRGKDSKAFKLEDFVLKFGGPKEPLTPEQQLRAFERMVGRKG